MVFVSLRQALSHAGQQPAAFDPHTFLKPEMVALTRLCPPAVMATRHAKRERGAVIGGMQ